MDILLIIALVAIIALLIIAGKALEKLTSEGKRKKGRKKVLRFIEKVSCCG